MDVKFAHHTIVIVEKHLSIPIFVPFAIETVGPIYTEGKKFLVDIGKKIENISGEPRSTHYLFQRISIALQNYNAGCVMGTFPETKSLDEIFLL